MVHLALDVRSESLLTVARKQSIAAALTTLFGEELTVDIVVGHRDAETPIQRDERKIDEKLEAALASLESDPNVQALKSMFGAELNPDSIEIVQAQPASNQE